MKSPLKLSIRTCSRGHEYEKSSDCPVCPLCWSLYYKRKAGSDFPDKLAAPAQRALFGAKIHTLKELAKYEAEAIIKLHGVGAKGLSVLKAALKKQGLSFKKSKNRK